MICNPTELKHFKMLLSKSPGLNAVTGFNRPTAFSYKIRVPSMLVDRPVHQGPVP